MIPLTTSFARPFVSFRLFLTKTLQFINFSEFLMYHKGDICRSYEPLFAINSIDKNIKIYSNTRDLGLTKTYLDTVSKQHNGCF